MGAAEGWVKSVLRIEGVAVLLLCLYLYQIFGFSWLLFAMLFFCPVLAFFAYLINSKTGAIAYNIAHSYISPILMCFAYFISDIEVLKLVGVVWLAHIGFDRMLGYGLKYSKGFSYTHLGVVGKDNQ